MERIASQTLGQNDRLILHWEDLGRKKITVVFEDGSSVSGYIDKGHPFTIQAGTMSAEVNLEDDDSHDA